MQNQNVSNRDENRSIPVSGGHCLSSSAHRDTSTHFPESESESESSFIHNGSTFNREIGSSTAPSSTEPSNGVMSACGVHVLGNGPAILAQNYEDVVTSSANRSPSRAHVSSNGFHQSSVPSPLSIVPPSYSSSETASSSRALLSNRNDSPSFRSSTPPPSYREVMEGAYSEPPPTYQQAVLHARLHGSESERL